MYRIRTNRAPSLADQAPMKGFEDILVEHCEALWRVALRLCNYNMQDAQDTLQDAIVRAFRGRESMEQATNVYAWLHRVLTNTFLNRVRDHKKWNERAELEDAELIASENYEGTPSLLIDSIRMEVWNDDINHALEALTDESRTLFLLSDIEGYTHEELAEMYDLPKGTVSARIYRARKKLGSLLEGYAIERGFVKSEDLESDRARMRQASALCPDGQRREQEEAERLLKASR